MWCAAVIIPALWLAPMVIALYVLLPYIYEAQFCQFNSCVHCAYVTAMSEYIS